MALNRMCVGLTGLYYYTGFCPLLNWWKVGTALTIGRTAGGSLTGKAVFDAGGYLEPETGEIVSPAPADLTSVSRIFFATVNPLQTDIGCNYAGEQWTIEWDGAASVLVGGAGTGATGVSATTTSPKTFTMGTSPTNTSATFTITDSSNPPRNIRVYQTRYASNVAAGEKFNPDWLAEVSKFKTIRTAPGWAETNNETITEITQLAGWDYHRIGSGFNAAEGVTNDDFGPKGSTHPEVLCDLAEAANVDVLHTSLPHAASDQMIEDFASFMMGRTTITIDYELSNEPWNDFFFQKQYFYRQGARIWGKQITGITPGNPTTLTIPSHGLTNGATAAVYFNDEPDFTAFDATNPVVTVTDANTITIPINTTGLSFVGTDNWITQDTNRAMKWYGYRAAQMMKIIKGVYNDPTRWRGVLGTQTTNPAQTTALLTGVAYFLAEDSDPTITSVSDLFHSLDVTGYFGDNVACIPIAVSGGITQANPGVLTYNSSNDGYFSNGMELVVGLHPLDGMPEIDGDYVTVANLNTTNNTFELSGLDTSGYTALTPTAGGGTSFYNAYVVNAKLFKLMDESIAANIADSSRYPTKYQLFNEIYSEAVINGSATSPDGIVLTINLSIPNLVGTHWPAQKALAAANGLQLRQYEGGLHFVGDAYLSGYVANLNNTVGEKLFEFMFDLGHSPEMAEAYLESYKGFYRAGGVLPAKFVMDGTSSQFGTWGGIRYWPLAANGNTDDTGNPLHQAVLDFNDNPQPETYAINFAP